MSKDLLSKIEELRTRPAHVRNRYAFFIALTLTLIIVVLWATTLPSRLSTSGALKTDTSQNEQGVSIGESFGIFANDMKEKFSALSGQLNKDDSLSEAPTSTPSNMLDIEALLASSSEEARIPKEQASSTDTLATSSATTSPNPE